MRPSGPGDLEHAGSNVEELELEARLDPAKLVKGEGSARALLLGSYQGSSARAECQEHLDELARLCETFGIDPVAQLPTPLRAVDSATYFGKGKVAEVADRVRAEHFDLVVLDEEVHPSQQRNLERALHVPVLDRTEVILGVFAQRAQTKEARLQVQLAQAKVQLPRLRRLWTHLGRQSGGGSGGGAYLRGEGEKQIELDKRMLRSRIDRLEEELEKVRQHRAIQRHARDQSNTPIFAVVGYTNAGKSTLVNALTDAGVLAEDKLFATLDTTTRRFTLPHAQPVLLTDTVGFIRKLPHQLVQAFRSTLEEAVHADLLLHVVDASHPAALEQAKTTLEVLHELGAEGMPTITVLNKIDAVPQQAAVQRLRLSLPRCVSLSARTGEGFDLLMEKMSELIASLRIRLHLRIPQADYAVVGAIRSAGFVVEETYEGNDVLLVCDVPKEQAQRWSPYWVEAPEGLAELAPPPAPWGQSPPP